MLRLFLCMPGCASKGARVLCNALASGSQAAQTSAVSSLYKMLVCCRDRAIEARQLQHCKAIDDNMAKMEVTPCLRGCRVANSGAHRRCPATAWRSARTAHRPRQRQTLLCTHSLPPRTPGPAPPPRRPWMPAQAALFEDKFEFAMTRGGIVGGGDKSWLALPGVGM